jgi:hypothetical protein
MGIVRYKTLKHFSSIMHLQNDQNMHVRKYDERKACRGIFCASGSIGSVDDMDDLLESFVKSLRYTS